MNIARICSLPGAVLFAALTLAAGCEEKKPKPVATPPPVVIVSPPVERTVVDYQVFTARTQAVQSVDITARITGYLTKILFVDGSEVKEGDVLFQIDDRPYDATLKQAQASLEVAKAALIKAQADYEIGLRVAKQDTGAISKQELTKRLGARDESKGSVDKAIAALENAQLNFGWCKVTAPISGRINQRFISVGNLVNQDKTVLTNIVSLKPTWAFFDVDQNTVQRFQALVNAGTIKAARTGETPVKMGLGADADFLLDGAVDFISNQLDPNTGSIRVRATFPNKDGSLAAGMFGRVKVPMSGEHAALLVIDRAIGTDQGQKFILIVNDKNEVEYRAVEVGQLHHGMREIVRYRTLMEPGPGGKDVPKRIEVLKPTDHVIVSGLQRVRPGFKVDPKVVPDMRTLISEPK